MLLMVSSFLKLAKYLQRQTIVLQVTFTLCMHSTKGPSSLIIHDLNGNFLLPKKGNVTFAFKMLNW